MRIYFLFILLFSSVLPMYSQEPGEQCRKLTGEEVEALFLKNNLELIAERYQVDIADAAVVQAKLWDNPSLSVGSVNLWSTDKQRSEIRELATSSFAGNTQFSVELEQLVQTAGKRRKLVQREKVSKEIALQEFEEVLRGLKAELRKSVCEVRYYQAYLSVLLKQRQSVSRLIESYRKQVEQANIGKSELLRLQSSLLDLENEINGVRIEWAERQKTLKVLLNTGPDVRIEIEDDYAPGKAPESMVLSDLLQAAYESRPDMKQRRLQSKYFRKSLGYEKALRIPDVTLGASYDRYGGIWKNFVGVGISVDLPLFNRNQGNIRAAKLGMEQSGYLERLQQNRILHEVVTAYNSYACTYDFYKKTMGNSLLPELDAMLDIYTRNLLDRNISMLEYVDFMDTYKVNKQILLETRKNVSVQFEELQYIVGTDIK